MLPCPPSICARCFTRLPARNIKQADINSHVRSFRLQACNKQYVHPQEFQAFAPPAPSDLPKPKAASSRTFPRTRRWGRRLSYFSLTLAIAYVVDKRFNASVLTRSTRAFATAAIAAADYKINFRPNPPFAPSIAALHDRNARRLFDTLIANGGLYLKIGQAIAMQSAILPPEFQKMFSKMFDDAPQNDWADVAKV